MSAPLLSVAIPTRNRPELLERALGSVVTATRSVAECVEVTVSDGSSGDASAQVVRRLLSDWPGGYRYVWNDVALNLPANINRAIGLTTGEWILQLHDDDYLLPGAGAVMQQAVTRAAPDEHVLLFGVDIVNEECIRRKSQKSRREHYLPPKKALRRVLTNSSFVRQPAAVVRRSAFDQLGLYDMSLGGPCDTEMWVRLFSRFGVRCVPHATCAYTIHEASATATMWTPETIAILHEIFDRARALDVVPQREIRRWEADFFHQFILAGAHRHLRRRQRAQARQALRLFELPEVQTLPVSPKWLPVRAAFLIATVGA